MYWNEINAIDPSTAIAGVGDPINYELDITDTDMFGVTENESPNKVPNYEQAKKQNQIVSLVTYSPFIHGYTPDIYEDLVEDIIDELYNSDTMYSISDLHQIIGQYIVQTTTMTADEFKSMYGHEPSDEDILEDIVMEYAIEENFLDIYLSVLSMAVNVYELQNNSSVSDSFNTDQFKVDTSGESLTRDKSDTSSSSEDSRFDDRDEDTFVDEMIILDSFDLDNYSKIDDEIEYVEQFLQVAPPEFTSNQNFHNFSEDILTAMLESDISNFDTGLRILEEIGGFSDTDLLDEYTTPQIETVASKYPNEYLNVFIVLFKFYKKEQSDD